jgi:signal transduction histidine kinase
MVDDVKGGAMCGEKRETADDAVSVPTSEIAGNNSLKDLPLKPKVRLRDRFVVRLLIFLLCTACFSTTTLMAVRAIEQISSNSNPLLLTNSPKWILTNNAYRNSPMFAQQALNDVNALLHSTQVYPKTITDAPLPDSINKPTFRIPTDDTISRLEQGGALYFVTDGTHTATNIAALKDTRDFSTSTIAGLDAKAWFILRDNGQNENSAAGEVGGRDGTPMDIYFEQEIGGALAETGPAQGPDYYPDLYITGDIAIPAPPARLSMFVAYGEDYLAAHDAALEQARNDYRSAAAAAAPALASAICCLVLLVALLALTGRRRAGGNRRLYALDRLPMELQILVIGLCIVAGALAVRHYLMARIENALSPYSYYPAYYWPEGDGGDALACLILMLVFALALWCMSSLVRNLKARTFARRSLVCLILRVLGRAGRALLCSAKSGFDGTNPLVKTLALLLLFWMVTALLAGLLGLSLASSRSLGPVFFLLLLATFATATWMALRWTGRYAQLRRGIEEVSAGNVSWRIEVPANSMAEFDTMSRRVNDISSSIARAVEAEIRSQRLKTDLISNVSHDLKTPLTSIITYTDLLQKEGLESPGAAGYLKIIAEKGQRLQKLTEDLFEAAKASSGILLVKSERVELRQLMQQVLAETEEGLAAAGLEVIVTVEAEGTGEAVPDALGRTVPVASSTSDGLWFVTADGSLLWRVLDNLLSNVRKYALTGSRVYVDLRHERGGVALEIKNISAKKLNISTTELMERFTRGDESRTTEGSGLGLAIASDLVRLMGGVFSLQIDGDLFKATVWLR